MTLTKLELIKDITNKSEYAKLLRMEVVEVSNDGYAKLSMPFRKELTHPYGLMHGGAIISLADSATAVALLGIINPEQKITTIEMKINFFAPIKEGIITAECRIIYKGSRTAVGDIDIRNESKILVAKSIATYMIL